MRDLLRLIAEPALAKRDKALRTAMRGAAGRGTTNAKAILLMDGTRTRTVICKEAGIDSGNLSRLLKSLKRKGLVSAEEQPELTIQLPADFFEATEE